MDFDRLEVIGRGLTRTTCEEVGGYNNIFIGYRLCRRPLLDVVRFVDVVECVVCSGRSLGHWRLVYVAIGHGCMCACFFCGFVDCCSYALVYWSLLCSGLAYSVRLFDN